MFDSGRVAGKRVRVADRLSTNLGGGPYLSLNITLGRTQQKYSHALGGEEYMQAGWVV